MCVGFCDKRQKPVRLNVPAEVADLVWRNRREVLLTNNLASFDLVVNGLHLATASLEQGDQVPVTPEPSPNRRRSSW